MLMITRATAFVCHSQSLLSVYGYLRVSWMYYNAVDPQQILFRVGVRARLRNAEGRKQAGRSANHIGLNDMIGRRFH